MFRLSQLPQQGLDAMNSFKWAALVNCGDPLVRFQASHNWALLAFCFEPVSLEGYMHCMMLLPLVVWQGTSVSLRYERLMRDIRDIVTKAVAAAILARRHDLGVEWLEQGRSVVWGQTLQLRTPYDDLYAVHPKMAQELQYVSHQLEYVSMSNPDGQLSGLDSLSSHRIAWRHHHLAERREELLTAARLLPGLENFLLPPKASQLINMVQDGVVVMVNVWRGQCDALILRANPQAITHVSLVDFSVQKAEKARSCLAQCLRGRSSRRGIKKWDTGGKVTFKHILAMLWHDVVKPVLDHIGIAQRKPDEDLPHITWCTTGYLSFLPLHAAGDYSNPSTVLSNLAVSSYAPTLSSLGQHTSSAKTFTGILAVGHESSVRKLASLPGTRAELDQIQEWAKPVPFTRLDGEKACADTVLKEMENHSWVHFACHASQNTTDPMKSALHLHDKDLDLATIARTSLKNAQLAFLSACQTATGDVALPDEAVHLAAGLLVAGFDTIIATMWSIDDKDAPIVARKVYECLLESGVPDSRKAAKALHKAVEHLREQIGVDEFARWVPYIHIGR
ncbi:hypothetical protein FS749_003296 [Ceratobasidium sp. UAMH 11750]|nr:hypothetical protein FS749_003296 [Ceratobasidium sp. UAMH 11750]